MDALGGMGARAERRGGYAAALAAYERAAALATSANQRTALTFAAARNAWACGQVSRARELLSVARGGTSD